MWPHLGLNAKWAYIFIYIYIYIYTYIFFVCISMCICRCMYYTVCIINSFLFCFKPNELITSRCAWTRSLRKVQCLTGMERQPPHLSPDVGDGAWQPKDIFIVSHYIHSILSSEALSFLSLCSFTSCLNFQLVAEILPGGQTCRDQVQDLCSKLKPSCETPGCNCHNNHK